MAIYANRLNCRKLVLVAVLVASCLLSSCGPGKKATTPNLSFTIQRAFPHDPSAFTQGLVIDRGRLFESTGREGQSWIAEVDIASGRQDKKIKLDKKYFGEGITILGDRLYQLTWQNHAGFVYDINSYQQVKEFRYDFEGWGITHDGKNLIVSDGTNKLHFLDTATLKEVSAVEVRDEFGPVSSLNELEYINGAVFANQWQTNIIWRIDPATGLVTGKMDLGNVSDKIRLSNPNADVLNGITYEKKSGLMLVTGKLWPYLFAIKLNEEAPAK